MKPSPLSIGVFCFSWCATSVLAAEPNSQGKSTSQVAQTAPVGTTKAAGQLEVEVLSQTVSKLERDTFGGAVNPFHFSLMEKGESGVMILARVTPRFSDAMKLRPEQSRLVSFKDDTGTDLLVQSVANSGDTFFAGNRTLEIQEAREGRSFGIRLRSSKLPSREASRITAVVRLAFVKLDDEQATQSPEFNLKTSREITVEPLRLRFRPSPPPTNAAAYMQPAYWMSLAHDEGVIVSSLSLFSKQADEPLLTLKNLDPVRGSASGASYSQKKNPPKGRTNEYARYGEFGFKAPADGSISVKLRFFNSVSLVEQDCIISTGLSP